MKNPVGRSFLAHAPGACRRLAPFGEDALERAEAQLAGVAWHDPVAVLAWVTAKPFHAAIALAALANRPYSLVGERLAELVPELAGLAEPSVTSTYEHEPPSPEGERDRPTPLLDHVLRALHYAYEATELRGSSAWECVLTTVLLYADVAKGGTSALRTTWQARLGVDGAVHNEDSGTILADAMEGQLGHAGIFAEDVRWRARAVALVRVTGLVGMRVRGEVDRDAFEGWLAAVRAEENVGEGECGLARCWRVVNRCDTAAVRTGLWTPALAESFRIEEDSVLGCPAGELTFTPAAERIARLRRGAHLWSEERPAIAQALARLGDVLPVFEKRFRRCRVWYGEPVLGALRIEGAVRMLVLLTATVEHPEHPWHLDLREVIAFLREGDGRPRTYPTRLLETFFATASAQELAEGRLSQAHRSLVSFPARKGQQAALMVRVNEGEEARALLTLLRLYEQKEVAAFHTTLKALCDLYGLRKDEFDRVSNEASYLSTMNAARSDKARMLDYGVPGTLVEVGPGGGIVLDLLAERFSGSRVIGLDASSAVVEALEKRKKDTHARWEVIHGDAFKLPEFVPARGVNTVVFCSVLHEIFSYIPWPPGAPDARRFQFTSVAAMIGAAFRTLAPGGRIIVRDGLMPAHEPRRVVFHDKGWRDGLELFARVYEARRIPFEARGPMEVVMDQADLFEFLTTWTWGPDAFPYEIREQRGVLPRGEYVARLLEACREADPPYVAREVPVEPSLASYLQKGYPDNIDPKLTIFNADGARVPMPDANGVWVVEKQFGG